MRCWFKERPAWQRSDKSGLICLDDDCTFFIEHFSKTTEYCIPREIYSYDGASIPWAVRPIVGGPFDPPNLEAATPHDPFYFTHAVPRWMADEAAFLLWKPLVGLWGARIRWAAVRSPAGALAWRNGDKEKADLAKVRAALEARPDVAKFRSLWFAPSYD